MAQDHISQDNPPSNHSGDPAALFCRLAQLSASEVAQEMEQVLGTMTPETYDAAVIDAYLDELDRKAPMPELPDEESAWDALQARAGVFPAGDAACPEPANAEVPTSLRPLEHKRKWRRIPFIAAALIACMLMTLGVAQAAGGDLIQAIISWTDETLNLSGAADNVSFPISAPLTELANTLDEIGITEPVMPHYLPDGYEQVEFDYYPDMPSITVAFEKGDNNIVINIMTSKHGAVAFQKNAGDPEIYKANGLTFYIMKNVDVYTAAWLTDNYCCSIGNVSDRETLLEMVNTVS